MKRLFIKKKEMPDFFQLLASQCETTLLGAEALISFMEDLNQPTYDAIGRYEKEADQMRKDLIRGAESVLITPMERQDMFALSRSIDDIMDKINDMKDLITVFKLKPIDKIQEIAALCRDGIACLCEAISVWNKDEQEFWDCLIRAKKNENVIKRIYWQMVIEVDEMDLPLGHIIRIREMNKDMNSLGNKIGRAADHMGDIKMKLIR